MERTYELHIAAPVLSTALCQALFAALTAIGLTKNKFFYRVVNICAAEGTFHHTGGTPPTGHDLATPGSMTTAQAGSYAEARQLIIKGMRVLAEHRVQGNFEIEGIIAPTLLDYPAIAIDRDFPNFRAVDDSPRYENHIIWKGPGEDLPGVDQVTRFFVRELRLTPHQIVDFGRDSVRTAMTVVSRVATFYQPSREAALRFAKQLRAVKNTIGYRYAITEQVILVGEPV
ncbi:MAG: hypothetical protein EXS55_02265 [Candidatus Magasanikbacteria bacterium]|nr:hypothetical protein [Candidatus Magasanikbacteria bacterium]